MFDNHVPAKYQADAPKSVMDDDGIETMVVSGRGEQLGQPERGRRLAEGGVGT